MTKLLVFFFSLLAGISFSQNLDSLVKVVKRTRVKSLKTEEKRIVFLENLNDLDQGVREMVADVEQTFGYRSPEHDSAFQVWVEVDRLLFEKTVDYLEVYSYPQKEMGGKACSTPLLIFHHVSGNPDDLILKRNYFSLFYQAYNSGSVGQDFLWFYLFRLYQQIKKVAYTDQTLREEEQIEEMITELGLLKE